MGLLECYLRSVRPSGRTRAAPDFTALTALIHDGKAGIHQIRRIARVPGSSQPMAANAVSAPRRLSETKTGCKPLAPQREADNSGEGARSPWKLAYK